MSFKGLIWFVAQRFCQLVESEVALRCVTIIMSLMLWLKLDIAADGLWPSKSVNLGSSVTGVIFSIVLSGCFTKPQTDGVVISFAVYNGT